MCPAVKDSVTPPTSPLAIPDYRRFWLARFASVIATNGMVVILGYQLYDLARGEYKMSIAEASLQLGLLGLAQFIPIFVLTPIAGVVADRFDRRFVAGGSMLIDLCIAGTLGLVTALGALSLPVLFGLAALHGAVRVFQGPALSAIAPNIVPASLIPRAIALNSIAWQAGGVIGPASFGFLFASSNSLPYWTSVILLLVASASLLSIKSLPPPPEHARKSRPIAQIVGGLRFVWNDRFLLGCITLDLFAVILGGVTALLPIFARDVLHVGPEGLGPLRAAPALGAAVVALVLSVRPIERNVGVKMLLAVGVYGLATIAFAFSRHLPTSLAFLTLLGAADMVSVFIRSSLIQLNTPDEMRGRVSATSGLAVSASNELGEMRSGIAAALFGVTGAVVFGGAAAIIVTILWSKLFPEIRRARTFAPQYRQMETDP